MKLYLAYIPIFIITFQNIGSEKECPGKYIAHSLGKHELVIKENGKFVSKGYNLVPKQIDRFDPPPGNMPTPVKEREKRKYKTKGTWIYFKKDNLDGIVLITTNNQTDSLFFQENGNLGNVKPRINRVHNDTIKENDSTVIKIVQYKYPSVRAIGVEYKKIEN